MGSCTSNIEKLIPKQWMEVFQIMQLTRSEIRQLHHLYKNYSGGDPNGMDIVEWLTLIDIDRTTLSERLFWASDRDGDHLLNFYEFVLSMWRFCVLGDGSLNIFAFDMYDTDGDGILRIDALTLMFKELLGEAHATTGTNKFVLSDLRKHYPDGSLTSEQWRPFSQTHQVLFHEIFTIQRKMRKHTLGEGKWHTIGQRKVQLAPGKFVAVSQLMLLHSDRHLFESLLLDKNKLHLSKGRKLVLTLTENAHTYHTKHETHNKAEREADEAEYQHRLPENTHHEDIRAGEHPTHSHQSAHKWAERHYGQYKIWNSGTWHRKKMEHRVDTRNSRNYLLSSASYEVRDSKLTDPAIQHQKAPYPVLVTATISQFVVAGTTFALLVAYFASLSTTETVVSATLLDGYDCEVLSPMVGVYYDHGIGSANSSENGQFAGSSLTYDECLSYLTTNDVCSYTYDWISVMGLGESPDLTNAFAMPFASGDVMLQRSTDQASWSDAFAPATYGESTSFTRPSPPELVYPTTSFFATLMQNGTSIPSSMPEEQFALGVPDGSQDIYWYMESGSGVLQMQDFSGSPVVTYDTYDYSTIVSYTVNAGYLWGVSNETTITRVEIATGASVAWTSISTACNGAADATVSLKYDYASAQVFGVCVSASLVTTVFSINPHGAANNVKPTTVVPALTSLGVPGSNFQVVGKTMFLIACDQDIKTLYYATVNTETGVTAARALLYNDQESCGTSASIMAPQYTEVIYAPGIYGGMIAINTTSLDSNVVQYFEAVYYMLSYSFSICNGERGHLFVNVSSSLFYSVYCSQPNGFYYQAPNIWYNMPSRCAAMQPDALLRECPEVVQNMQQLKDTTCSSAIDKLCRASYTLNPPFSCSRLVYSAPLTILANALANTTALWGAMSLCLGLMFVVLYKNYDPFVRKSASDNTGTGATTVDIEMAGMGTSSNAVHNVLQAER